MKAKQNDKIITKRKIGYGSVHGLIEINEKTELNVLRRNGSDDGIIAKETITLNGQLGEKSLHLEVWDSDYEVSK